jgi:hypothetical protein
VSPVALLRTFSTFGEQSLIALRDDRSEIPHGGADITTLARM